MRPTTRGRTLAQFGLAGVIVILLAATATAVAALLQFKEGARLLSATPAIRRAQVVVPQPGGAQTILVLGSDHRAGQPLRASNSDTIMLVRIDPASSTINVISIPRDLRVTIPGNGIAKINAAYSLGGPNLVVKTIRASVFPALSVNHIVDVNFRGFRQLVDAIGCVYTDVDRRYFHLSGYGAANYSSIDVQPGYQKLCGEQALAYVRYRHTDTDIVRAARQQDFVRQAKDQYGQANLIADRARLLGIFGANTQTDADLHTSDGLENLFNLVAFSDVHSIRTVHFPAILETCAPSAPCYVSADPTAEGAAYRQLMRVVPASAPPADGASAPGPAVMRGPAAPGAPSGRAGGRAGQTSFAGLVADGAGAAAQRHALSALHVGLAVLLPRAIAVGSRYATQAQAPTPDAYPRSYHIGHYASYRVVLAANAAQGQFYGIQGTTWRSPPILAAPLEKRVVAGRALELHWDGRRLRLVARRTPHAVYWISNTLSLTLSNEQMLGMAASLSSH